MPLVGLTKEEAEKNRLVYGANEIKRIHKINPYKIFFSQFTSPLIIILIAAAFISAIIGYLPGQTPNFFDSILIFKLYKVPAI